MQNGYLGLLIDPSCQGLNSFFILPFENEDDQESWKRYFFPTIELKISILWCYDRWKKFFRSTNKK